MMVLFLIAITLVSSQNIEIFDPDFLKNFNPLRIYRDPFKFDDIPTEKRMDQVRNFDFILPKILENAFEFNDEPRNSMSYAPIWFKI